MKNALIFGMSDGSRVQMNFPDRDAMNVAYVEIIRLGSAGFYGFDSESGMVALNLSHVMKIEEL